MRRARMADEAPSSPPPECYICTESDPPPRKSACKCVDRYVHDACLAKMLETATEARCPVCLESYANVASKSCVVRVNWWSAGGCATGLAIVAIIVLGCAANTFAVLDGGRSLSRGAQAVAIGSAIFLTVVGLGVLGMLVRLFMVWGCRELVRSAFERKLVVRVLPTPTVGNGLPVEVELAELAEVQ